MSKSKTTPRAVPSDDSKAARAGTSNVTPITSARKPKAADAAAASDVGDAAGVTSPEPALILFGKDDAGKAHASWFGEADAELAIKAAGLMKLQVLKVDTPEVRAKALELPAGRIFSSCRGFVPFCKMAAYEALSACAGAFQPPAPVEVEPLPFPAITGTPQKWDDIGPGSLVLAMAGDDWGWHEAVVAEARGDDLFVLKWRNWPEDPDFARRRDGLALLPPQAAEAA